MRPKSQNKSDKCQTLHAPSDLGEFLQNLLKAFKKMEAAEADGRWDFGTGDLLTSTEINTIDILGHNSGINMTALAELRGLSKAASPKSSAGSRKEPCP